MEWMAAMKLACRGRTMADTPGYQAELHALRSLLQLHHNCPSASPASPRLSSTSSSSATDAGAAANSSVAVRLQDLIAARHLSRLRHKQVRFYMSTLKQANREGGMRKVSPGPTEGAPSPKNTEKGAPDGFFMTSDVHKIHFSAGALPRISFFRPSDHLV